MFAAPYLLRGCGRKVAMATSRKRRPKSAELIKEARNRATPPERLRELAVHPETHSVLARNPLTPVDLLWQFAETGPVGVVRAVATSRHTPEDLLVEIAETADVRIARSMASRSKLPDRACVQLAGSAHYTVQWAVVLRKQLPVAAIDVLARNPESKIRRKLASHPDAPADLLREIAADPDPTWAIDVLHNTNVDEATVAALASHGDPAVRTAAIEAQARRNGDGAETAAGETADQAVASRSKKTHTQTSLHELLQSPDHRNRAFAVNKVKSLTPDEVDMCAADACWLVRHALARRRDVSADQLQLLASDPTFEVRGVVAQNKATPADALQRLSTSEHALIVGRVASHANTHAATLVSLAESRPNIRRSIAKNPSVPTDLLWTLGDDEAPRSLRAAVARSANVNGRICTRAALDDDVAVRRTIAGNHAATRESLALLATDSDHNIRAKLAANPNTPPDMLHELAVDPHPTVYKALAHNPSAAAIDRVLAALQ